MHFSHKYGWPSLSGNYHSKPLLEPEQQRLRNVFTGDWTSPLCGALGQWRTRQSERWVTEAREVLHCRQHQERGIRLSHRQHQHQAGHLGMKRGITDTTLDITSWKRNEKREKMGKEIKERKQKTAAGKKGNRGRLVGSSPWILPWTLKSWLEVLTHDENERTKLQLFHSCVAHRYIQVKYLEERHTRFWNRENIQQKRLTEWGSGMKEILGIYKRMSSADQPWGTVSKIHAEIWDLTKTLKYGTKGYRDPYVKPFCFPFAETRKGLWDPDLAWGLAGEEWGRI